MRARRMIRFTGAAAAASMALVGLASSTGAAVIHNNGVSGGISPSFSKGTHSFMYLEGETATQGASDTFANPAATATDASRTFYRTSSSVSMSSTTVYDGARYTSYGSDSATFSNINTYWENLATGLVTGQYDVFVRTYQSNNGSQTFTLYAGADRSAVDSAGAVAVGTVSTPTTASAVAAWYKIGTVNVQAATDTFRLKVDTASSTIRYDTLLFAGPPVPEPSVGVLAAAGACMLMGRRRSTGKARR